MTGNEPHKSDFSRHKIKRSRLARCMLKKVFRVVISAVLILAIVCIVSAIMWRSSSGSAFQQAINGEADGTVRLSGPIEKVTYVETNEVQPQKKRQAENGTFILQQRGRASGNYPKQLPLSNPRPLYQSTTMQSSFGQQFSSRPAASRNMLAPPEPRPGIGQHRSVCSSGSLSLSQASSRASSSGQISHGSAATCSTRPM